MDILPYRLLLNRHHALALAQEQANQNGAPVAVVNGYGWYRVVEDAEQYEDMVTVDGYQSVAVVEPVCQ